MKSNNFSICEETNLKNFFEWSYTFYHAELEKIVRSRFLYKNIAKGIDVRYLERALMYNGVACLSFDEIKGEYMGLSAITQGPLNEYGLPYSYIAKGYTAYQRTVNQDNSILILNNDLMTSDIPTVSRYAHILANLDTTLMLNSITMRKPYAFIGDKKNEMSMKTIWKKILSFEPLFLNNKGFNPDNIQVLDLLKGSGHMTKDIYDIKTSYFNEFLTHMGISNVQQQKKERMISDEVSRGMGGSLAFRNSPFECRKRAIDEFNEMFGENMSVEFNESLSGVVDDARQQVVGNDSEVLDYE